MEWYTCDICKNKLDENYGFMRDSETVLYRLCAECMAMMLFDLGEGEVPTPAMFKRDFWDFE